MRVRSMEQGGKLKPEGAPSQRLSQCMNGRIPIFAISASLREEQREQMKEYGIDGWILKPVDFKRLFTILRGITDPNQREKDLYNMNRDWEYGGWLTRPIYPDALALEGKAPPQEDNKLSLAPEEAPPGEQEDGTTAAPDSADTAESAPVPS